MYFWPLYQAVLLVRLWTLTQVETEHIHLYFCIVSWNGRKAYESSFLGVP